MKHKKFEGPEVLMRFVCQTCDHEVFVTPSWVAECGTPICAEEYCDDCDEGLAYDGLYVEDK